MKTQTKIARKLRKDLTLSERKLWYFLRLNNLGFKFRRQSPIGHYIVDFVCYEKRLVIELDGGQHSHNEQDKIRDQWLCSQGFMVIRFWNNEVLGNLPAVVAKIKQTLDPSLTLPIKGREEYHNN